MTLRNTHPPATSGPPVGTVEVHPRVDPIANGNTNSTGGKTPPRLKTQKEAEPKSPVHPRPWLRLTAVVICIWSPVAFISFRYLNDIVAIIVTAFVVTASSIGVALSIPKPKPEWMAASAPEEDASWWSRLHYKLYAGGLYKLPKMNPPSEYRRPAARISKIMEYVSSVRHSSMAIIVVYNTKGGALKTTTITWVVAVLARIHKLAPAIFDTDTGHGKVAKRFGLDPAKVMASTAALKKKDFTYEGLVEDTGSDPDTGTLVFHMPAASGDDEPGATNTAETITSIKKAVHTLGVDTAPGLNKPATVGASSVATIHLVAGDITDAESLDDIRITLDYGPYNLRNRSDSVLVVIGKVPWRHFNAKTRFKYSEIYGIPPDQIFLIPFLSFLETKVGEDIKPPRVVIDALKVRELYAWCRLAAAITRCAVRANANTSTTPPTPEGTL